MAASGFSINCGNSEFQSKIKSVFDGIDHLKRNHSQIEEVDDNPSSEGEDETDPLPPKIPAKPWQKLPNFVEQPESWVKYDLKDIKCTSNSQNIAIAQAFLKTKLEKPEEKADLNQKPIFKTPAAPKQNKNVKNSSIEETSSKVDLDHLDEDASLSEYQENIIAKLQQEIEDKNPAKNSENNRPDNKDLTTNNNEQIKFKSRPKVNRKSIRRHTDDE